MSNKIKKNISNIQGNKLFRILCVLGIALLSLYGFRDYGLTVDEPRQRNHLLIQTKHIFMKAGLLHYAPKTVQEAADLQTYPYRFYGVAGQYPLLLLEYFPVIFSPEKPIFWELRHLYTRVIFLFSAATFFFINKRITKSKLVLFISMLLYMFHPRIFAHSFYNIKDLLFLSFMVFSMFFLIRFNEKTDFYNLFLLSIFSAFTINIRIMGIVIPLFVALWLLYKIIIYGKNIITHGIIYILITSLTLMLVWPTLWTDPIRSFCDAFIHFSHYSVWQGTVIFNGSLIKGNLPPLTYVPVWIGITSPASHLLTWLLGILVIFYQLKSNLFSRNVPESELLIGCFSLYVIILSFMAVIIFRSTLYGDWRHLYYLFPMLCFLSVIGLEYTRLYFKRCYSVLVLVVFASLTHTLWWMVYNHPHQNVFFNFCAGRDWGKKWDRDLWRSSYKQITLELIKTDVDRMPLIVHSGDREDLSNSLWMLPEELKAKICLVSDIKKADYAFGNYRNVIGDYPLNSFDNMKEYLSITIDGNKIMTIFKRERLVDNSDMKKQPEI